MKDPAFLFYSSDFLSGISDLTMEERGQYITLLCLQHQKGHLSDKLIKLSIGNATADVLQKFCIDADGLFFSKRLDVEITKRVEHSNKQRQRAIDGWEKRKATADATALPLENENENENININDNRIINDNINEIQETIVFPSFDDFWIEYDKKVGDKDKIKKKFDKLPQKEKEKIMAYLPEYKNSTQEKRFRKNPETFLNNKSWNDELININNGKQNNQQPIRSEKVESYIEASNLVRERHGFDKHS